MTILTATFENLARKIVEDRPTPTELKRIVRQRKPTTISFSDDGVVPNNPRWPMLVYRKALVLRNDTFKPETIIDALFSGNGWRRSWRSSIYDYLHYHSQIHEALGVARGSAEVQFGGVKGRTLKLAAGDVVVLPAGTGHQLLKSSRDFLVVGAYPSDGRYDECTDTRDRQRTTKLISKVKKPKSDPIYGKQGLITTWTSRK